MLKDRTVIIIVIAIPFSCKHDKLSMMYLSILDSERQGGARMNLHVLTSICLFELPVALPRIGEFYGPHLCFPPRVRLATCEASRAKP